MIFKLRATYSLTPSPFPSGVILNSRRTIFHLAFSMSPRYGSAPAPRHSNAQSLSVIGVARNRFSSSRGERASLNYAIVRDFGDREEAFANGAGSSDGL